ncbi:pollen receptor-like kinase 3 [Olea europaea var. sylvestris]|uniref:pollen receptor-like kinase 3 n=1 Tax=Olea europaea var. sylvestris TaxID=158386 RepID=UPI000C1D8588|nr:pollen receptor-like kinase 3 [Olea europaea var. sylvestris]
MAVVQFLPSYFLIFILIFCVYTPCMSNDGVPLYDFKEKLNESASLDSTWIKGTDPCHEETKWKGVECNSDNVINLYLMNYGLSGDIAIDSLVNLKGLRVISLENNSFSGPLPSFNRLTALKSLYLTNNEFSGEIPLDFFSKMGSLKKLELARNKFSGRIPDSLTKLQNLRVLFLQQNEFTGPIPSLAQKSLDKIDLSNNKLQGEIPPTMSRFGTKPFEGNPNLCGTVLSKECKADDKSANEAPAEDNISENKESGSGSGIKRSISGDRGIYHGELNWPTRLKIIQGVAQGMGFLHNEFAQYELPHGNLKSSNILLSSDYEPLLNDYMLYPLISNTQSVQQLFAYKTPEAILYQQVSPKSDVFCLGVVILEIVTGKFPSQYLNNQKGGTDVIQWTKTAISENKVSELIDLEIANTSNSLDQMEKLLYIGAECTESDQDKRIVMKEAIKKIEEVQV